MTGARKKRGQGRPVDGESSVGRDALLDAATRLLRDLPPGKVTISSIAREAGTDPALVRYYFGDRTSLLQAVVARIATGLPREFPESPDRLATLTDHIHGTFRFTRSAKHMQRLMIDELADPKHPQARAQTRAMNQGAVDFYAELMKRDGGESIAPADPLFLHLAVVGIADFFASAQPLVEMLAPEGADIDQLARDYEAFVVDMLMNGLKKR
ncbi:TetR/AcrR family transcriptional regulator [Novosphingobium sp. BL-52-GroH]|uniref:TetR/AcrR family transcriptional regulator n=1 Tax=Novosphingobium sp. BL-52-GroH TaxID=3349877 RepID=UPI0038501963